LDPEELEHGNSNTPRRFWDIEHARRVVGYDPQDATPTLIGNEDGRDALVNQTAIRKDGQ
jgi:hypothetical protein